MGREFSGGKLCLDVKKNLKKMLQAIQKEYNDTVSKMEKLRLEDKTKTVTYKQLMGTKIVLQNMISRYEIYGLLKK
ncbi:MAG: hypothetical protein K2K21_16830 [Lachnospiraceae bacterium]|nr:hypothetical protein [Lachnospiraceae bacterium]